MRSITLLAYKQMEGCLEEVGSMYSLWFCILLSCFQVFSVHTGMSHCLCMIDYETVILNLKVATVSLLRHSNCCRYCYTYCIFVDIVVKSMVILDF